MSTTSPSRGDENWAIFIKWSGEFKYDRIPSNNPELDVLWSNLYNDLSHKKPYVARVSGNLLYFVLRIWREEKILISVANINTYFSLRARCWLRGGVGGQFPLT